jgi:signal transduction histidine kinase
MRTLLVELRPAALTEARIGELLRHLTVAMTSRIRTPVQFAVEGDCHLPPDVQVALYRITQEALNNVAKHAKPGHVSVDLNCGPGGVTLRIIDDGRGFDSTQTDHPRLGLAIMRERAESIGALYTLESQPGMGTQIEVVWMIPETGE